MSIAVRIYVNLSIWLVSVCICLYFSMWRYEWPFYWYPVELWGTTVNIWNWRFPDRTKLKNSFASKHSRKLSSFIWPMHMHGDTLGLGTTLLCMLQTKAGSVLLLVNILYYCVEHEKMLKYIVVTPDFNEQDDDYNYPLVQKCSEILLTITVYIRLRSFVQNHDHHPFFARIGLPMHVFLLFGYLSDWLLI